jgi:hypothetical protein
MLALLLGNVLKRAIWTCCDRPMRTRQKNFQRCFKRSRSGLLASVSAPGHLAMHPVSACLFVRFNRLPDFHGTKHGSEIAAALSKIDQILEIASRYENTR